MQAEPTIATLKVEAPPTKEGGTVVGSVGELVQKLQDEAKVL